MIITEKERIGEQLWNDRNNQLSEARKSLRRLDESLKKGVITGSSHEVMSQKYRIRIESLERETKESLYRCYYYL